jgi:hypothetical protein
MKTVAALLFVHTAFALTAAAAPAPGPETPVAWQKTKLETKFISEGAHFADFNRDGKMDIISSNKKRFSVFLQQRN